MMNLEQISYELTKKYVISPIDNKTYCRANGDLKRHLRSNGFETYRSFFHAIYPQFTQYCSYCGVICSFNDTTMQYCPTCGDRKCQGKLTADILAKQPQEFWDNRNKLSKQTNDAKSKEEKDEIRRRTIATGKSRNSYKNSVQVREQTCFNKYGDTKYNNSKQISKSKLNWTPERLQLYKDRLSNALNGKRLNDFCDETTWYNRSLKLFELGLVMHPDKRPAYRIYRLKVHKLTERNYKQNKHIINPNNFNRTTKKDDPNAYHLDHIIPVRYGFINNIPANEIAATTNLQMLHYRENIIKGCKYES